MAVKNKDIRLAIRPAGSTDPWQTLRFTNETFSKSITNVDNDEVRTDRMQDDSSITSIDPQGQISINFSADTFDELLAALMHSAFVNGVAKVGTTEIAFDMLKTDTKTGYNWLYSGMKVSQGQLTIEEGALIKGTLDLVGLTVEAGYDASGDTVLDQTTTGIINSNRDIDSTTFLVDGVDANSQGLYINSLSISVNNNYSATRAIANVGAIEQSAGAASITGSMTLAAGSAAYDIAEAMLAGTDKTLEFTFGSGRVGESDYTITVPRLRVTETTDPEGSLEGDATVDVNFSALRDATTDTSLSITKVDDVV